MNILGPKDPRLRRRRCIQCVLAHIKCTGLLPCAKCVRRGQRCTYPPAQSSEISIENGKHLTPGNVLSVPTIAVRGVHVNVRYFDRFFEAFVTTNKFSSAASAWNQYLRTSIGSDAMLASAITAVGTLHNFKTSAVESQHESILQSALTSYQEAVSALRKHLSLHLGDVHLCSALSTTFLLGLFELMYDPSGDGWKRHMMYGVSRLLDLSGPDVFYSREVRGLYREVRLFEITRAVLLSQSSPLTQSSWVSFNHELLANCGSSHPKEAIFDMMLSCADVSLRTHRQIDTSDFSVLEHIPQLQLYAAEGFALQLQLLNISKTIFRHQRNDHEQEQIVIAQLYYFATMIYLSGIYDYDKLWQENSISTPTLARPQIGEYVGCILDCCVSAMDSSNVSHLLLLVPLRIAAARCNTPEQRRQIQDLLLRIQATFAVAHAFLAEIRDFWAVC